MGCNQKYQRKSALSNHQQFLISCTKYNTTSHKHVNTCTEIWLQEQCNIYLIYIYHYFIYNIALTLFLRNVTSELFEMCNLPRMHSCIKSDKFIDGICTHYKNYIVIAYFISSKDSDLNQSLNFQRKALEFYMKFNYYDEIDNLWSSVNKNVVWQCTSHEKYTGILYIIVLNVYLYWWLYMH